MVPKLPGVHFLGISDLSEISWDDKWDDKFDEPFILETSGFQT